MKNPLRAGLGTMGVGLLSLTMSGIARGAAPTGQAARGWTTYKDPLGFSVQVPAGWKVLADRGSGRVQVDGPDGERMILWPRWIPGAFDARAAGSVLQTLVASPGVSVAPSGGATSWGKPQAAGSNAVRMLSRSEGRAALAVLSWVASPKGAAASLDIMSAPEAVYRRDQETFALILKSFAVAGGPVSGEAPAALRYVRWQDPRENAFSLEVPSGWRMSGGLFRFAPVDTRPAWQADSPDGQIRIAGGDASLPSFTLPNQMLAMGGFREGSWYSPGYGVKLLVRRYVPGTAFAREYVSSKVAHECTDLRVTEARDRADAAGAVNAVYRQYNTPGASVGLTAGEVAFTCNQNGRAAQGYYFAGTQLVQTAGMGGLWHVEYLFGYVAAAGRAALAQSVLNHMLASTEVNPQWMAMQQGITANTSQIVSHTQQEISRIIHDTYWSRQPVMDEISRRRSNATLGVVDVVDPETGRQYKVENSSNYYWVDPSGTIVGTQTHAQPDVNYRQLSQLP